jgi:hypothetical protein
MEPLWPQQDFFSLYEFARRHQIGLTTIYAEIKAGRLTARKIGRRTVIAVNDAEAWREQLPRVRSVQSQHIEKSKNSQDDLR